MSHTYIESIDYSQLLSEVITNTMVIVSDSLLNRINFNMSSTTIEIKANVAKFFDYCNS